MTAKGTHSEKDVARQLGFLVYHPVLIMGGLFVICTLFFATQIRPHLLDQGVILQLVSWAIPSALFSFMGCTHIVLFLGGKKLNDLEAKYGHKTKAEVVRRVCLYMDDPEMQSVNVQLKFNQIALEMGESENFVS
ncbi:hypothetical protein ACI77O_13565 [Pseudomonas tritici]|uniref:hypothetical protein n=1 Tax=Pseudomonas tritici TaxID=2745518 RepID=UPI00387A941F